MIVMGASVYSVVFPFLLQPILGLLAAMAVPQAARQSSVAARLGRLAPLATLGLLLRLVLGSGRV
jgi:hypothetical protein